MPFEFPSFLKKNQIRHGEFEKIFFYEIRHGEFEYFHDDAGNDTIQCYMALYLLIISISKPYVLKKRKDSLIQSEISIVGV